MLSAFRRRATLLPARSFSLFLLHLLILFDIATESLTIWHFSSAHDLEDVHAADVRSHRNAGLVAPGLL